VYDRKTHTHTHTYTHIPALISVALQLRRSYPAPLPYNVRLFAFRVYVCIYCCFFSLTSLVYHQPASAHPQTPYTHHPASTPTLQTVNTLIPIYTGRVRGINIVTRAFRHRRRNTSRECLFVHIIYIIIYALYMYNTSTYTS